MLHLCSVPRFVIWILTFVTINNPAFSSRAAFQVVPSICDFMITCKFFQSAVCRSWQMFGSCRPERAGEFETLVWWSTWSCRWVWYLNASPTFTLIRFLLSLIPSQLCECVFHYTCLWQNDYYPLSWVIVLLEGNLIGVYLKYIACFGPDSSHVLGLFLHPFVTWCCQPANTYSSARWRH